VLLLLFPGAATSGSTFVDAFQGDAFQAPDAFQATPATAVSTYVDAFQGDAFQAPDAFQTTPVAAPTTPPVSDGQGAGVKIIAPSRKKLKRLLEEAGVAESAIALELEGDGQSEWTDEEILLLLEVV
jgi:hypothetical protein